MIKLIIHDSTYSHLKGYSTPKWKFGYLSLTPMSFRTRKSFIRLQNKSVLHTQQNAYTPLYQLYKAALLAFKSERKLTYKMHPCAVAPHWRVYAFCVQGLISKMALRWCRGDVTVPNIWIKSLFLFYFHTKSILVAS